MKSAWKVGKSAQAGNVRTSFVGADRSLRCDRGTTLRSRAQALGPWTVRNVKFYNAAFQSIAVNVRYIIPPDGSKLPRLLTKLADFSASSKTVIGKLPSGGGFFFLEQKNKNRSVSEPYKMGSLKTCLSSALTIVVLFSLLDAGKFEITIKK